MSASSPDMHLPDDLGAEPPEFDYGAVRRILIRDWKRVAAGMVLCAAAATGISFLVTPKYTASAVFMPPQQQQGGAAGALASLGALSSLAGAAGLSARSTPEQYIALMQSVTVSDRIIKRFGLQKLWEQRYEVDTRKILSKRVDISTNKKDGLIKIDVTDESPVRAADMANRYVDELRALTNGLAVTEAQQRRVFFEKLLEQTRDKLAAAQAALEAGGYNAGALNVEPRSAAEAYARLLAARTSAEVKLQVLRTTLSETAPEVVRQRETIDALGAQIAKLEGANHQQPQNGEYISRYREFKYQETLFDLYAKQYEAARVDEAREGALIQVVDVAEPPERKSAPTRRNYVLVGALLAFLGFGIQATRTVRKSSAEPV